MREQEEAAGCGFRVKGGGWRVEGLVLLLLLLCDADRCEEGHVTSDHCEVRSA